MRLFQVFALSFTAVMLAISARALFKRRSGNLTALFWCGLWLATFMAVLYPDTTTRMARAIGIGRGADLLLYSAVIAFAFGFYLVSLRLRHMSREITLLTRELALLDAERAKEQAPRRQA